MIKTITENRIFAAGCTFSSQEAWKHFRLEKYHFPAMSLATYADKYHTLIFNTGGPISLITTSDQQAKKIVCGHGQIASLNSLEKNNELILEQELNTLILSFESEFTKQFLETPNFNFKTLHNIDDPVLANILWKLDGIASKNHINEQIYCETLLLSCLIHLACNYSADGKKLYAPKGKLSASQLSRLIDYTRAAINTNISLSQLASRVHLSAFHFARLFRNTVGISPYQFVLQLKIEYAKELIRKNHCSLSDVAYALSFTDQAHFSNAFKKITGMCPRLFISGLA